jgi:hypothetical protein
VYKDGEYSFTMPAGNNADGSYTSNLDQGGLQLSGTFMVVNHFRHVWAVRHGHFILGLTLDAAGIRAEIANGQFTVVGQTELDGQQAVELQINVPSNDEAPPHVTVARLWVDATTYLPMREYLRMSNGWPGHWRVCLVAQTCSTSSPWCPSGRSCPRLRLSAKW